MLINFYGINTKVEYIRVHRDALRVAFYGLIDGQWARFHKGSNKQLPTYRDLDWPNPEHMFGWSNPYRLLE